jgi:hypothetical protein
VKQEEIKPAQKEPPAQKSGFDLPALQMKRGGGFDFDTDILKEQQKNIDNLNKNQWD